MWKRSRITIVQAATTVTHGSKRALGIVALRVGGGGTRMGGGALGGML